VTSKITQGASAMAHLLFCIQAKIRAESSKKTSNPPRFDKKVGGIKENLFDSARNVGL